MAQIETSAREKRNGEARTALKSRTHDVLDDFAELKKDMARLAEAARKAAREEVTEAGRKLGDVGRDAKVRAVEGVSYAADQVRARPGVALGAALGTGVLLGLLLSRRQH